MVLDIIMESFCELYRAYCTLPSLHLIQGANKKHHTIFPQFYENPCFALRGFIRGISLFSSMVSIHTASLLIIRKRMFFIVLI